MAQRRHHYEQAFEGYLRSRRIPYVAVNEARKALLPVDADQPSLKSFDFVVYGAGGNLLVEIKGRRGRQRRSGGLGRLESWVHAEDVRSMARWESLFGPDFRAVFVFLYWFDDLPADGLFEELVEHRDRWYALRSAEVGLYAEAMRVRSPRWETVDVPPGAFERISRPFRGERGLCPPVLEPVGA